MSQYRMPVILLDGGLGTTLTEAPYNQKFDHSTPLWSSHLLYSGQDVLQAAQSDFIRAGADVLLSATYQASFEGFQSTLRSGMHAGDVRKHNPALLRREATSNMRSAISIAKTALKAHSAQSPYEKKAVPFALPAIALSLGPLGATLVPSQEYTGQYPPEKSSQEALKEWHADRIEVFRNDPESWDAVRFVAFETFKRVDEVLAVREVMAQIQGVPESTHGSPQGLGHPKGKKWWISTVWPEEITDEGMRAMVEAMLQNTSDSSVGNDRQLATPWAIGVNCTGIEKIPRLVQKMEDCMAELTDTGRWRSQGQFNPESSTEPGEAVTSPSDRPWLVLYPDGARGLRYDSTAMEWVASNTITDDGTEWPEALWQIAKAICDRGNWSGIILGGCCKTSPSHIRRLRELIDADQYR